MAHNEIATGGSIAELQREFGALLLQKPRGNKNRGTSNNAEHIVHGPKSLQKLEWSGPFRLLDLPRELRDNIYFHVSYRPGGLYFKPREVTYHRRGHRYSIWICKSEGYPRIDISLILANRQVYIEALMVLCRVNRFTLGPQVNYPKSVADSTLRIFPARPSRYIRRITLSYGGDFWKPLGVQSGAPAEWRLILRDSKYIEEFFPALRELSVWWCIWAQGQADLPLHPSTNYSEMVHACWGWLRNCYLVDKHIPPKYLRVDIKYVPVDTPTQPSLREVGAAFHEALARFRDEVKHDPVLDLEDLGRRWIEEEFGEEKKRKRKSRLKKKD